MYWWIFSLSFQFVFENENPIWKSHQRCWFLPLINWAFIMFKQLQTLNAATIKGFPHCSFCGFFFVSLKSSHCSADARIKKRKKAIIKILLFSCNRLLWVKTFTVFFDIWRLGLFVFAEQFFLDTYWRALEAFSYSSLINTFPQLLIL